MTSTPPATLSAVALNCTLKRSPASSSTDLLTDQLFEALRPYGVRGTAIRIADHDVHPGVDLDMGEGDGWPAIRDQVMAADILIIATPTWMGHMSSFCQRVLERLDAELSQTDDEGRPRTYGKVAGVVVVGNEDGAHHVSAGVFQGLNDVGFTIPAGGVTYWNGEAMHPVDYKDLTSTPEKTDATTKTLAANLAHLAGLLRQSTYPPAHS